MRCENCNVYIDENYKFAREKNQCPGCGGSIMSAEQLVALNALQQLILQQFSNLNGYAIATAIIENFEVKQKFKTLPDKIEKKANVAPPPSEFIEVQEDVPEVGSIENIEDPDIAYDEEFKKKQMAEAKKMIRDQAYKSAIRNQYGMGDEDEDFFDISEDTNPVAQANQMKEDFKRSESQNNMLSGGGSFSRSS